jgi:hypothetical protein
VDKDLGKSYAVKFFFFFSSSLYCNYFPLVVLNGNLGFASSIDSASFPSPKIKKEKKPKI